MAVCGAGVLDPLRVEHGEEIQEGKTRCPGAHEEKDEGGAKKEIGAKARSGRSIALEGFAGAKKEKKPAPKPASPPVAPSVWEGFGGKTEDH